MFGTFQQSNLRIEVNASESTIRDVLTRPEHLRHWMWPQTLSNMNVASLNVGDSLTSWIGPISIHHKVDAVDSLSIRFLLSQGIDGFHSWHWGDGWIQSDLEGVSLLPLNLGQTFGLLRLKDYLVKQQMPAPNP
ncbi:MAG: hypothetical protein IGR76_04435 [Synechococcales cyanobacterium T60_A2020_003]|nr:hypothetical protein [Synechococcales cyanobacterium T60_A2020_003]